MANGVGWTVRLLQLGGGSRFQNGWRQFVRDNLVKHGDFLTFTLVEVGIFHVKRYDFRTGIPPMSDREDYALEPDDDVENVPIESNDDYQPSDSDTDSSDGSGYDVDTDGLDLDGRPIFIVNMTPQSIGCTLEIPYGFWHRHIPMGALRAPVYLLTAENTWIVTLMHTDSAIWVNSGWRRFKRANGICVGDRVQFTLVNPLEVTFYVLIEKA